MTLLRSIKRRFGIGSSRVAVRAHVAWYWRWLFFVIVAGLAIGVARLTYDMGRQYAGFDHGEAQREKQRLEELNEELEVLNSEARELEDRIADNVATILEAAT